MDSSNGTANYKLEAIKRAMVNGELTKEEMSRRLTYAIDKEYEKQPDERDVTFIIACQKILYEMHTGEAYASQKEESKQALKKRITKSTKRSILSMHTVGRSLAIAAALVVLVFGIDALVRREQLIGGSTDDGEQYIISGQKIDPGLVDEGKADDSSTESQNITTTDFNEVVAVLGFAPNMPQWIPDGWELNFYDVSAVESSKLFTAAYCNSSQEYYLIYQITYYLDSELALAVFEQNKVGDKCTLPDGRIVYMSENYDDSTCIWYENLACYNLMGPGSHDTFVKIIESIKENP